MSKPDVSLLANETLNAGVFPAERRADFRVHIDGAVHAAIHAHAAEDTSVEICGVLVGEWKRDADGPFASVTQFIRCDNAAQKMAEVTFTHESWSHINSEMDSKYSSLRITGWYHSHPDFGIFLSDRDIFIQEHFFSGAGQVALVVDPVRKLEGIFEWRDGKPQLMSCYWVGTKIITDAAARSDAPRPARERSTMEHGADSRSEPVIVAREAGPGLTTLLAWLCLFLLGYLIADWRRSWEQKAILEGTVAHYGVFNLLGYGRLDGLKDARELQDRVLKECVELSKAHLAAAPEDGRDDLRKRWKATLETLQQSDRVLKAVARNSELTPEQERLAIMILSEKIGEFSGLHDSRFNLKEPPSASTKAGSGSASGKSGGSGSSSGSKSATTGSSSSTPAASNNKPAPAESPKPAGPAPPPGSKSDTTEKRP